MRLKFITLIPFLFSTSLFASPAWVEKIPSEKGYIMGVGTGEDISSAKKSALIDIGRTLYSNVSSTVATSVKEHNEIVESNFLSESSISSEDVLLPKVTWLKTEADSGIYYTLAKVKTSEIISLYEKTIDSELQQYENLKKKQKLSLNDYLLLVKNKSTLKLTAKRAAAISSLSKHAEFQFISVMDLFAKQNQFIGTVCFNVKKSNERLPDKIYLPAIESVVQADKFELKNSSSCIPVTFRAKTEKTGKTIAHVTMQLTIGSPAITSNLIKFKGTSSGSYKSAMFDASNQFVQYFQQNGGLLSTALQKDNVIIVID